MPDVCICGPKTNKRKHFAFTQMARFNISYSDMYSIQLKEIR